jgi:hypothetical protein
MPSTSQVPTPKLTVPLEVDLRADDENWNSVLAMGIKNQSKTI